MDGWNAMSCHVMIHDLMNVILSKTMMTDELMNFKNSTTLPKSHKTIIPVNPHLHACMQIFEQRLRGKGCVASRVDHFEKSFFQFLPSKNLYFSDHDDRKDT